MVRQANAPGLEYWEYRRAAFLAGKPFPAPGTPATDLPESYTVPPPPPPAPSVMYCPPRGSSIERLEALLSTFGAEESDIAWNGGVGGVAKKLGGGKQLAKGLRLGLVVSTCGRSGVAQRQRAPCRSVEGRAVRVRIICRGAENMS